MIDYLQIAKNTMRETEGTHPTEYMNAFALIAIAYALIAIAERLDGKTVER